MLLVVNNCKARIKIERYFTAIQYFHVWRGLCVKDETVSQPYGTWLKVMSSHGTRGRGASLACDL